MLEDHAHIPPERLEVLLSQAAFRPAVLRKEETVPVRNPDGAEALHGDAAGIRGFQQVETAHQGGLPGAGIAHNTVDLSLFHLKAHILQGDHFRLRQAIGF